jgi:hypothetical protein
MADRQTDMKRGPKGGIKHTPGRGHAPKSDASKKERFMKTAAIKRAKKRDKARDEWEKYEQLSDEQRRLLGPRARPKIQRPTT